MRVERLLSHGARELVGRVELGVRWTGSGGRKVISGEAVIRDLTAGGDMVGREVRLVLSEDGGWQALEVRPGLLRGTVRGGIRNGAVEARAEFRYVPAKLARVFKAFVTGDLRGDGEGRLVMALGGPARGTIETGLGRYSLHGTLGGGRLKLGGTVTVYGSPAGLQGTLDFRAAEGPRSEFTALWRVRWKGLIRGS